MTNSDNSHDQSGKESLEQLIERQKVEMWDWLVQLDQQKPHLNLPIVDMHDKFCAVVDKEMQNHQEYLKELAERSEEFHQHQMDIIIDYRTKKAK